MGLVKVLEKMGYAPKDRYGLRRMVQIPERAQEGLEMLVRSHRELRRGGFRVLNSDFGRILVPLKSMEEQLLANPRIARKFVWDMIKRSFDYELGEARAKALPQLEEAGAAALPALGEALRSENNEIRRAAVMGAKEVGLKGMPLIYGATADPDAGVREYAAWCLWMWRGNEEKVGKRLEEMLSDPDGGVRMTALRSLQKFDVRFCDGTKKAVENLAREAGNKWDRWEAERFLEKLEGGRAPA